MISIRPVLGRLAAPVVALVAAFTLVACDPSTMPGGSGPRIDTSKPVKVALLVPGGGGNSNDDLMAASLENATRLAMADLNGVTVDLRVYQTAGQPAQAASQAVTAVNEGAQIILGPVFSASAAAVGNAVSSRNINVISFSNNPAVAGGNVFIMGPTFDNIANRVMRSAVASGKTRIAIVHGQSAAEEAGRDAAMRAAARTGATIVTTASFELSQSGLINAIPAIAEQIRSAGAQAIFFTSGNDGALPLLAQLLPENGITPTEFQFMGLTRWDVPATAVALPGVQGAWFTTPDQTLSANFSARYEAAYGQPPLGIAGLAYDGIAAIGALVLSGNADALNANGLTRPAGFVGVNGIFRLLSDGTNERGLTLTTILNNQVMILDPAPRSFGATGPN